MQVKALWSLREKIPEALVRDGVTYKVRRASLAFTVLIANIYSYLKFKTFLSD